MRFSVRGFGCALFYFHRKRDPYEKAASYLLTLILCLTLCACGNTDTQTPSTDNSNTYAESHPIDDLLGTWHNKETHQFLYITPTTTLHCYLDASIDNYINDKKYSYTFEIAENTIQHTHLGKFEFVSVDNKMKLVCTETGRIAKGMEFTKVENLITQEKLNGDWYCEATGNSLEITNDIIHPNHSETANYNTWYIAGDTLYISKIGIYSILKDGDTIKLVDDAEEFVNISSDPVLMAKLPRDTHIEFPEPVLLYEDENVRLETTGFHREMKKDWTLPVRIKTYITLRFHNKSSQETIYDPDQFYIGSNRVQGGMMDGTPWLLPGKTGDYSFFIQYSQDEPLESIEDLYQLEARFEVDPLKDGVIQSRRIYDILFSCSDAF